ncbi:MAG TPA: hypothetical protein VF192_13850 [Longimicrobiales bacterium]
MNRSRLRTLTPALALLLAVATRAWADCAPYVSTTVNDAPNTGVLVSTTLVTVTITETWTFDAGIELPGRVGASGSGSYTRTTTTSYTYEVGHYEMEGGEVWSVDCRTYTRI